MHDLTAFANRLAKQGKQRRKWAAEQRVEAYRVYEADIPELRYIVDVYKDHAVVFDRSDETRRVMATTEDELAALVAKALGLPLAQVHVKLRRRMQGAAQYEKLATTGAFMTIAEESSRYLVNLTDYLDTGLFLDHRPLRSEFRRLPAGTRFLNLFCYTGSVSVAAAQAGAITTSVDMSNTYLDWAQENFRASGVPLEGHTFLRADALQLLEDWARGTAGADVANAPFDTIFLDPPTFSNSKKMDQAFDVQRDHKRLVERTAACLAPGGTLYFSTNRYGFVLDDALPQRFAVEDITERTIPADFRDRRVHRCYKISRRLA